MQVKYNKSVLYERGEIEVLAYKPTVEMSLKDEDFQVSGWCGNRPKCVQVAVTKEGVALRDSKDPTKTTLTFTHDEWTAFVQGVNGGQFNSPT